MSSLQTRISALITAIGADVKTLKKNAPQYGGAPYICPLSGSWLTSDVMTGTAVGAAVRNRVSYTPIVIPVRTTFTAIGINVTTALVGGTSPAVRLGVYADSGASMQPGTLLVDAGTVSGLATGIQSISISLALNPGLYWLAFAYADSGAPSTALQVTMLSSGGAFPAPSFALTYHSLFATAVSGAALPSTAPTAAANLANAPLVGLQAA